MSISRGGREETLSPTQLLSGGLTYIAFYDSGPVIIPKTFSIRLARILTV